MLMQVHDPAGRPLDVSREALRRTYGGLQLIARSFYSQFRPATRFTDESMVLSFQELRRGEIRFSVTSVEAPLGRLQDGRSPWDDHQVKPSGSPRLAAQQTAAAIIDLFSAYTFVLSSRDVRWNLAEGFVDLHDLASRRRLRVSAASGLALVDGHMDEHMREVMVALSLETVGTISLIAGIRAARRQIQFVVPATDIALSFVRGGALPGLSASQDVFAGTA